MLSIPAARSASLAPRIGDDVLPTPAEEWAEKTVTSIKHSVDFTSLGLPPSRTSTPGPHVPGAYPFEGQDDHSKGMAFHQGYIRTQKNVMDAVMGAGATAKRYLPGTWTSYLSSSTERKPIIPKDISQPENKKMQDVDTARRHPSEIVHNSGASGNNEALPQHLSGEAQASSGGAKSANFLSVHSDNSIALSVHNEDGIDTSHLTSHTNPDARRSSLLSDVSTRTINGSLLSSPSRYSSQLSLTTPRNEVLQSGSETADTTYHGSETGEPKPDHERESSKADTHNIPAEHVDSGNEQAAVPHQSKSEDDNRAQHGARFDTLVESPYPAFLGPVDSGSDRPTAKVLGSNGVVGSDMKEAIEGFQGVQQPLINTQARTHPLAGSDAKWNGIPLEEQYQKALDDNSDRQLNLGTGKGHISATKPVHEERKQGIQGLKNHADGTLNDGARTSRLRTTSVVVDKPIEYHKKSQRPVSEGYTPEGIASGGARTKNPTSPTRGSSKASRASFMDKLKGEMKVISGKLSNDGAKVKEGRRMMGKIA